MAPLRSSWIAATVDGAAGLLVLPLFGNDYVVGVGLTVLMWIALTQSWCVLSKMTGYISLGHVVFYGLGAYLVVVTWQQVPLALAIVGAGLLAAVFAALVGLPVLRVRGPYFVILSFGVAELVKFSIMAAESAYHDGARAFLEKPLVPETLRAVVAHVLAGPPAPLHGGRRRPFPVRRPGLHGVDGPLDGRVLRGVLRIGGDDETGGVAQLIAANEVAVAHGEHTTAFVTATAAGPSGPHSRASTAPE